MAGDRVLWLLSDGAPGHWSQSQGIADALAATEPVDIQRIDLTVRSTFWKRLGRLSLPWIRSSRWWLAKVYNIRLPASTPSLIISSGGNTLLANALLARLFNAPNVYSGTLKGYDASAYRVIFTVVSQKLSNNCILPLPPVPQAISSVPDIASDATRCVAVLIGGDGAGYRYTAADWRNLAQWLVALAASREARILLTTSRRTGAAAEAILQAELPVDLLADAVWWLQDPRPVVRSFLQRATSVVVTEDSLTMIAESIYSRREVLTWAPEQVAPNTNDAQALANYAADGLIFRSHMGAEINLLARDAKIAHCPDVPGMIRAALQPHLNLGEL